MFLSTIQAAAPRPLPTARFCGFATHRGRPNQSPKGLTVENRIWTRPVAKHHVVCRAVMRRKQ